MKKKKSAFRVMAEAFLYNGLKKINLPTYRVDRRKLTVEEIKNFISEEFGKAKKASDTKSKVAPGGWGDVEVENEVDWIKALNLKEFFFRKKTK